MNACIATLLFKAGRQRRFQRYPQDLSVLRLRARFRLVASLGQATRRVFVFYCRKLYYFQNQIAIPVESRINQAQDYPTRTGGFFTHPFWYEKYHPSECCLDVRKAS